MVETRLEIRFAAADLACATIDSNASKEIEQQAELLAFARYAARIVSLLGPDRAFVLLAALTDLSDATMADIASLVEARGIRLCPWDPDVRSEVEFRALASFVDTTAGPRMYFRLKLHGLPPDADASVLVLLCALMQRRAVDDRFGRRLAGTAALLGRVGVAGEIRPENEFDVSLAAADVAWRRESGGQGGASRADLRCPGCGGSPTDAGFEPRLWPSDEGAIRKCVRCGAGLWDRESRRPRLLEEDVWNAMEQLREELGRTPEKSDASPSDGAPGALLAQLKWVFTENRWPFSEVRGAPVLVSELSGARGSWTFYAQAVDDKGLVLLYSICPVRAPEDRRLEVAHLLTRANYGLAAGNFELDLEDGEIRYKTALQVQGDGLDRISLKRVVRANGIAMETYLPAIRAVIDGASALSAAGENGRD